MQIPRASGGSLIGGLKEEEYVNSRSNYKRIVWLSV